jgi:polyhydroxyalkanoate synthesis regulator phasin
MSESNGHITKQDLLDMEGRLHNALRGDIKSLQGDVESLRGDVESLETRLRGDMEKLESRVHADIEGVETKLLTEFWKWGRASEQKMRRVEFSDATTVERLSILEERVFTLERKVAGSRE